MKQDREIWVDYVKVLACVLVVLGHFFQSMVKSGIIPESNIYLWFDTTIYYFHVPLFFICSGYLYQKFSIVDSWSSWKNNIIKKLINLGVPYVFFSSLTWIIKTVFADATSNEIGGYIDTLAVNPYPPYWYLYILILIFAFTITIKTKSGMLYMAGIALIMKIFQCIFPHLPIWNVYAIQGVFANEIWFVAGMCLAIVGAEKIQKRIIGLVLAGIFLIASICLYKQSNDLVEFGLGIIACLAVFMLMVNMNAHKALDCISPYTMPLFLMHTLIAAPVRIIMTKIGIYNQAIHILIGLIASFVGPMIAFELMKRIKLDVLVFPGRYIKGKTQKS